MKFLMFDQNLPTWRDLQVNLLYHDVSTEIAFNP